MVTKCSGQRVTNLFFVIKKSAGNLAQRENKKLINDEKAV